jgi:hypothetical protein
MTARIAKRGHVGIIGVKGLVWQYLRMITVPEGNG